MRELHPLATQFAGVAEAYERGRPDYPPAVAGALAAELGLAADDRVLDLGAGTGKLTRALFAAGLDVVAVEPQPELRERLAGAIGTERVVEGFAEAIPLADHSVAAVTVADAFHWFDRDRALTEIRRVLRAGGGLAIVTTIPDWTWASWADEVGTMISDERPEHPNFDAPSWREFVRAAGDWAEPREIRVTVSQPTNPSRIVAHVESMSWVAAMPGDRRAEWLTRIAELVESGETPAELPVHFVLGLTALA